LATLQAWIEANVPGHVAAELVVVLALGAEDPRPQQLERELLHVAKELVKELQERGCTNVGVLEFQISKDGKTLRDRVGTLTLFLARQLEVGLLALIKV